MTLEPGVRLGPYEIESALGAGGMGEVYRAKDTRLDRIVAIKVLPKTLAADPQFRERFDREARAISQLTHPHICVLHDVGHDRDVDYLVMEHLEGQTLADRLASAGGRTSAARSVAATEGGAVSPASLTLHAIPLPEVLTVAIQIADALDHAHRAGIVHRDLKPGNVMLTRSGAKLLDFGLAKTGAAIAAGGMTVMPTTPAGRGQGGALTAQGTILGTFQYMAPEQLEGKEADARSDIFAFGCVLYEMLTGTKAFEGKSYASLIASILDHEPPPISTVKPIAPPLLDHVIARCLAKNPEHRWATVHDLRFELQWIEERGSAAGVPAPVIAHGKRHARATWIAGALALASIASAALTGVTVWMLKPSPSVAVTRFPFTLPEGQQFTNTGRQLVSIAPDGSAFVYVANTRLFLKPMKELSSIFIRGTEIADGVLNPVFSPDSRSLAFWSAADQTLKRIAVGGGAPVTIAKLDAPVGMSWGLENQILVGQGTKGIVRVSASGGTPETIVTVKAGERAHGPQMLPDGVHLLFTLATATGADQWDKAQIVVQSLKSGERKVAIEGGTDARYLPTGHLIYALAGTLLTVPFDVKRLAVSGGPVPIIEGVRAAGVTGTSQLSVADNGSLVYIPGAATATKVPQNTLALVDRNGSPKPLGLPPGPYNFPRISPSGKQLAFDTNDAKDSFVWIYDLDGKSSVRRLTFGGKNFGAIWSVDGQRLLYTSDREAPAGLFWQRADGSGVAERVTRPESSWPTHLANAWAPDGQSFLFKAEKGNDSNVWMYSIRDRKASQVIEAASWQENAVFSPDGRWIAYQSWEAKGVSEVYVQPFPPTGAKYLITKDGGNHPVWSPDGKELFFMNNTDNGQLFSVSVRTQTGLTFGNPVGLAVKGLAQRVCCSRDYDITPDGKQFVVILPGANAAEPKQTLQIQVVLGWFDELKQRVPTR